MEIVLDDGFQFGLGFFETICLKNGQPEFLDWHLERLQKALLTFQIPQTVSSDEVFNFLKKETENTDIPNLYAMKIMVSSQNKLFALRPNPYSKEKLEKGFVLGYSNILRNETSPLTYHKSMNYGDNILEKRRTKTLGIDELIFKNSKGEICEGSTTNIFFVRKQQIYTPDVKCGLLPGILRKYIMKTYPVIETHLHEEDVSHMDSCFVTNSLMGIMPVRSLGTVTFRQFKMTF